MKIAIIGGGWAGLSAACQLHRAQAKVTIFESAHILGGRARSVFSPPLNAQIDNGQHILLGAYDETLSLMRQLGIDPEQVLHRLPLTIRSADGRFVMRARDLPAPLHLLTAIAACRGLGWVDKLRLVAINQRLRQSGWRTPHEQTVAQWLEQGRQSSRAVERFWRPLCIAALNTPIEQASAQMLAHVLRDSLGGPADASTLLLPRTDLSALWPERLPADIKRRYGHTVRTLVSTRDAVFVDDERFDAVVVAANVPSTRRLLGQAKIEVAEPSPLPGQPCTNGAGSPDLARQRFLNHLAAFSFIPIATLTLRLERPWRLPCPMLMLFEDTARHHYGQWLFDRSQFPSRDAGTHDALRGTAIAAGRDDASLVSIVISNAGPLQGKSSDQLAKAIIEQVREQTRGAVTMPHVLGHALIIEKRATFAATPGLERPHNQTPWPRVWVAGDWTDTDYPAVLEGAVRSGKKAATMLLDALVK